MVKVAGLIFIFQNMEKVPVRRTGALHYKKALTWDVIVAMDLMAILVFIYATVFRNLQICYFSAAVVAINYSLIPAISKFI